MQIQKIPFENTHSFSPFFLDYIQQKESLKPFYHRFPLVDRFKDQIAEKSKTFPKENRQVLARVLAGQYKNHEIHDAVKNNLTVLSLQKKEKKLEDVFHELTLKKS